MAAQALLVPVWVWRHMPNEDVRRGSENVGHMPDEGVLWGSETLHFNSGDVITLQIHICSLFWRSVVCWRCMFVFMLILVLILMFSSWQLLQHPFTPGRFRNVCNRKIFVIGVFGSHLGCPYLLKMRPPTVYSNWEILGVPGVESESEGFCFRLSRALIENKVSTSILQISECNLFLLKTIFTP